MFFKPSRGACPPSGARSRRRPQVGINHHRHFGECGHQTNRRRTGRGGGFEAEGSDIHVGPPALVRLAGGAANPGVTVTPVPKIALQVSDLVGALPASAHRGAVNLNYGSPVHAISVLSACGATGRSSSVDLSCCDVSHQAIDERTPASDLISGSTILYIAIRANFYPVLCAVFVATSTTQQRRRALRGSGARGRGPVMNAKNARKPAKPPGTCAQSRGFPSNNARIPQRHRTEAYQNRTEAERHRTEAERHRTEAERHRTEAEQNRTEAEQNRTETE